MAQSEIWLLAWLVTLVCPGNFVFVWLKTLWVIERTGWPSHVSHQSVGQKQPLVYMHHCMCLMHYLNGWCWGDNAISIDFWSANKESECFLFYVSLDCLGFFQKHAIASAPVQILRVLSVYATEGYALGIDSVKSLCLLCSGQMNFLMGTTELCPLMKDHPDERPPRFQDHFWLLVTFSPSYFSVNKLLTKDHPSVQTTFFFPLFLWWCYQGPSLCPEHLFFFFWWWCYKRGVPQYFIAILQTACDCSKQIVYLVMPPRRRATCFIC